eukprot:gene9567-12885_t
MESKEDTSDTIGNTSDFKPGQKYPTPSPGNGDRVFYETLYQQKPESEMAQEWCLAYGILDYDEAEELNYRICKRKGKPLPPTPAKKKVIINDNKNKSNIKQLVNTNNNTKITSNSKQVTSSSSNKKKKMIVEDDIPSDTGFASSTIWEGQGSSGI